MKNQVFTVFTGPTAWGNPAEVVLVDKLPNLDAHLKYIQSKLDHSDHTMVYIKSLAKQQFAIRWFNNKKNIKRCGHGTLAAAAFIHKQQNHKEAEARYYFLSDSESIEVIVNQNTYTLTFPIIELRHISIRTNINTSTDTSGKSSNNNKHTNTSSLPVFNNVCRHPHHHSHRHSQTEDKEGYIIVELDNADSIQNFTLDDKIIEWMEKRALIITARSNTADTDIVFRYFAPQHGQIEDTATGSAGSVLWPFWQSQFNNSKRVLRCSQLSEKGGYLLLTQTVKGEVNVSGNVIASPYNEH